MQLKSLEVEMEGVQSTTLTAQLLELPVRRQLEWGNQVMVGTWTGMAMGWGVSET